jgi:hypothetical protein
MSVRRLKGAEPALPAKLRSPDCDQPSTDTPGWIGSGARRDIQGTSTIPPSASFPRGCFGGPISPSNACVRGGAWGECVFRAIHGAAGCRIDKHRLHRFACIAVDEMDAYALRREMPIAPGQQRQHHGAEIVAALREHILITRRALGLAAALHQPRLDQRVQPPRQHVRRNAKAFLERVEARQPVHGVAENENAPPFADTLEAACDRAWHGVEAFALH